MILKLAQLLRVGNKVGQPGWMFKSRQVKAIHYGVLWGHGGKEQESPLPTDAAQIREAGSQWWPIIWVEPVCGNPPIDRLPVYCPGLAWQNARPWYAHPSRVQKVETPGVIIEELDDYEVIENVSLHDYAIV